MHKAMLFRFLQTELGFGVPISGNKKAPREVLSCWCSHKAVVMFQTRKEVSTALTRWTPTRLGTALAELQSNWVYTPNNPHACWLLVTGWVQAYKQVHPYGSLLYQVASFTNTTGDCT